MLGPKALMIVGVLHVKLRLHGCRSLKAKRSVVKGLLAKTEQRFRAAVAEVADQDMHTSASLGFCIVSGDSRHADQMLSSMQEFIASATPAEIVEMRREILRL